MNDIQTRLHQYLYRNTVKISEHYITLHERPTVCTIVHRIDTMGSRDTTATYEYVLQARRISMRTCDQEVFRERLWRLPHLRTF
jgi:hypothetical protein